MRSFILTGVVFLVGISRVLGATVALHSGDADPSTEGWTGNPGGGPGQVVGPVNDGGTQAWAVDDNSTALNSIYLYSHPVSGTDLATASALGWTLSARLRVVSDEVQGVLGSPFISFRDGTRAWQINFGLDAGGNTTLQLPTAFSPSVTGPTHTLTGNASYHNYALVYDPLSGTADLLVDGFEVISDHAGAPLAQTGVLFGSGRSPDSGQGNFNRVELSVAPEPGKGVLFLAALGGMALRRRR